MSALHFNASVHVAISRYTLESNKLHVLSDVPA